MTAKEKLDDIQDPFKDRYKWEEEIALELSTEAAISYQDALEMVDSCPFILEDCWKRNIGSNRSAKRILNAIN